MKYCSKGKHWLTLGEFNKRSDMPHILRSHCKKCSSKQSTLRRQVRTGRKKSPKRTKEAQLAAQKTACKKFRSKPEYKAKHAATQARRRADKLQATPKWLTEYQTEAIEVTYELAKHLSDVFGEKMSVDHIIPLKNKIVCGLHVPWNLQVMPKDVNSRKSNKLDWNG